MQLSELGICGRRGLLFVQLICVEGDVKDIGVQILQLFEGLMRSDAMQTTDAQVGKQGAYHCKLSNVVSELCVLYTCRQNCVP